MYIVKNYCKFNCGGKLPPKHTLSNVLMHALEVGNQNVSSEPMKHARSRQNPTQRVLESHGIVFLQVTNTNKSSSDLVFHGSPAMKEEEEEQLNMVLKQSLIESGTSTNALQESNPCSHLPHHQRYFDLYNILR